MKSSLISIELSQFKGSSHARYGFQALTRIMGANGSGKTTILDAHNWLWADRDASLTSNPAIRPINMEESLPTVTEVIEVDGKEIAVAKFQKMKKSKPDANGNVKVSLTNGYTINAVPKTERDFKKYFEDLGVDLDKFLVLSCPDVFTAQKDTDCRNTLFGMVGNVTDEDVAKAIPECKELAEQLASYSVDEVSAMAKATKKKSDEMLKALPDRIIGLEMAKTSADTSALEEQKANLESEIATLESEITSVEDTATIRNRIAQVNAEVQELVDKANEARIDKLNKLNDRKSKLDIKYNELRRKKSSLEMSVDNAKRTIETLKKQFEECRVKFEQTKAMVFDTSQENCKMCGQRLPADKIGKIREDFEKRRKSEMDSINKSAATINSSIKKTQANMGRDLETLESVDADISALRSQMDGIDAECKPLYQLVDISGTDEYKTAMDLIGDYKRKLDVAEKANANIREKQAVLSAKRVDLHRIESEIAKVGNNDHIDRQIAELQEEQKVQTQNGANAEMILEQLKTLSMKKNQMLSDQVNSHFNIVRFELFKYLKNGEVKDACIPYVKDGDEWKELASAANTALQIRGKLDIIRGLQRFYGQYFPVFLDGAECLDSTSIGAIEMDTQLILLSVSEDKELKVE